MALSIFTNASSMSANNALNKANSLLTTSMQRLGTGKRINTSADDAAGLQIASRLQSQVSGMSVAKRNISDATAMLQTAEGGFGELNNIMDRMKDLATQSANATNTQQDHDALQSEFKELNGELNNIMSNTSFGGEKLMSAATAGTAEVKASGAVAAVKDASGNIKTPAKPAVLAAPAKDATAGGKLVDANGMNFQIGDSTGETLNVNISDSLAGAGGLQGMITELAKLDLSVAKGGTPASGTGAGSVAAVKGDFAATAQDAMTKLSAAMEKVTTIRSKLGANINRLGHTAANLSTMQDNTNQALGNIRDVDYSTEASNMSRQQMLSQTSMAMLKQSNNMSQMVMGLMQQ
ncbi:flagellin [Serratia sp. M24T3]|uniref:flagellin N-terminal helical domain-containing protein n=1 Tax=Serratia sp. M24T3 TaxID=932213 RepID=UPI00025B93DB|nr:flagellin [Serratia sp. M24T3]EIC83878.1 hypothetical protein SPM24T3_14251 [Serratia sp. M24T3]